MPGKKDEKELVNEFNKAVHGYWVAADLKCEKGALAEAANEVFLARDALKGAELAEHQWNDVTQDIADIGEHIFKNDVPVLTAPQKTSTGRTTYKILNRPRSF